MKFSFDRERKLGLCTLRYMPAAMSKEVAVAEMTLAASGIREPHWHNCDEYMFVSEGSAKALPYDATGRSESVWIAAGEMWVFPDGVPHAVVAGPTGARCLLTFALRGEFETFAWEKPGVTFA